MEDKLHFIKATFDGCRMVEAWIEDSMYDIDAVTQEEFDELTSFDYCVEWLRHRADLPPCFDTYEEWVAKALNIDWPSIMLDNRALDCWSEICELSGIDEDKFPFCGCRGVIDLTVEIPESVLSQYESLREYQERKHNKVAAIQEELVGQ